MRNRASGIVRVGGPLVLALTALPAIIQRYTDERPKVVVRVRDISVDRLVDTVASGDTEIAIGPDRAIGAEVSSEPIFDSPWVLWCARDHPLAKRRRLRWDELRELPLVAAGRDHELGVEPMRLSAPEEQRVSPVDVVDNVTTAFGIAAQGRVATFGPEYVRGLATTFDLIMLKVVDPETVRNVCLYRPLGRSLSPAAEGFALFLADELRSGATGGVQRTSPKR